MTICEVVRNVELARQGRTNRGRRYFQLHISLLRNFIYAAAAGLKVTASPRPFAFFWMLRISCSRYFSS
jgi:hypothetical protein